MTRGDRDEAAELSTTITIEKLNTINEMMPATSVPRIRRAFSAFLTNPRSRSSLYDCSHVISSTMDTMHRPARPTAISVG
jgi:hypothetical protein